MTNKTSDTGAGTVPDNAPDAVFTSGSVSAHVIKMTAAGAVGLVAIFAVDLMNLFYISLLGKQELTAAVGYATTLMFFTLSLNIGLSIASSAIVSRALGAGRIESSRVDAGVMLVFVGAINVVAIILLFPFLDIFLGALGASGNTLIVALDFLQIVLPTTLLMGLGMVCSGLLRARGDAKRAMYVTLGAAIAAAILDPFLILYLELGVRGAAISVVFFRIVLLVIGFYGVWFVHKMIARPDFGHVMRLVRPFLYIAIPAMLTQIATPFSNAYVTSIMSQYGDGAVTGWAIIGRLVPLAFVALFTLTAAVGPILGQNLGAQKFDRITATMWSSLYFAFGYTMFMWLLLVIFSGEIIAAFGLSGEAASLVKFFCLFIGGTYVFQGGLFVANAAFNNLGYPYYSTLFNWGRATIGTIPFAWAGAYWGAEGALLGYGIGGILFGIAAVVVCFWVIRRLPDKVKAEAQAQAV